MLAADKLQLQSLMKQQAVTLKEKEFNLHHSNCMTIGTQAAVLAGLDITMFIEFTPISLRDFIFGPEISDAMMTHSHHAAATVSSSHHFRSLAAALISSAAVVSSSSSRNMNGDSSDSADGAASSTTAAQLHQDVVNHDSEPTSQWMQEYIFYYTVTYHILHFLYYSLICTAFCCNVIVVAQTTILSVLGAGLALRGPDGSMMTATNILYQERSYIFRIFGYGLTFTVLSVFVGVWLMFQHWATALSCWLIATYTCYFIYSNYQRVSKLLYFHDNESVDLHDLLSITQQQYQHTGSRPSNSAPKGPSKHQRHRSYNSNESVATGDDYYDDDETLYSSENPETESFIHNHNSNNNNNSRRRRTKYSQPSSHRNNEISAIQMV
jgi:hypothetical protein